MSGVSEYMSAVSTRVASFVTFQSALTHYSGRVTQVCVFNTVKLGTSASSP